MGVLSGSKMGAAQEAGHNCQKYNNITSKTESRKGIITSRK